MTMCRVTEEPCNGKLLSTVLETSGDGDILAEFTKSRELQVEAISIAGRYKYPSLEQKQLLASKNIIFR